MIESTSWHSYPSIYALGHKITMSIFSHPVTIEEKIDGSQFSFGIFNGELKLKSKNKELSYEVPEKMFMKAVESVITIQDKLTEGWTYRAEYLQSPRHNVMHYESIPLKHLMVFDINTGHEVYLPYAEKKAEAERLGLEAVPLIFEGIWTDATAIPGLIERKSCLGGSGIEGVVIKNYGLFGPDKKCIFAKYVTETFKEIHKKSWGESNPRQHDILVCIISSLTTEARWLKVVQHLKEAGEIEGDPRDIGKLMKELHNDVRKECLEHIQEQLLNWALPHVLRGCGRGFPEWYKKHLLEGMK